MFHKMRNTVAAVALLAGMAPAAFAGGAQLDNKSLIDVLQAKGILSNDEVKVIKHNNNGKFKFGGKLFIDATHDVKRKTGSGWLAAQQGDQSQSNGVNLTRAYLTARYYINDTWKVRVTTDVHQENALGKKSNIFLKYAYIQGDLLPAASLRLGVIHTPWIDYEEGLWEHRYVSTVLIDGLGIESSADAGLGVVGKVMNGLVHYQFGGFNGGGYTDIRASKAVDFSGRIGIDPIEGLTVDFQYRNGYRGKKRFGTSGSPAGRQLQPVARQIFYQAMVTYGHADDWRVAAGYVFDKDKAFSFNPAGAGDNKRSVRNKAFDVWGRANLLNTSFGKVGAFFRYDNDHVNPYNNLGALTNSGNDEVITHYILGVELKPAKGVNLSLVYNYNKTKNRITGAGTATPLVNSNQDVKDYTIGLFSQLAF